MVREERLKRPEMGYSQVYDSPAYSALATRLLSAAIRPKGTPTLLLKQFTVGPKQAFENPRDVACVHARIEVSYCYP